jgi:hypothetical protein
MKHSMIRSALFMSCLALAPLGVVACSDAGVDSASDVATGTFTLPLTTTAGGDTYRLNATLYLYGPVFQTLSTSAGDPAASTLSTTLQTGPYSAYLIDWSLEKFDAATGNFAPTRATLVSSTTANLVVHAGSTTTVTYRFQVEDVAITIGAGELRVKAEVDVVPPSCTLMGGECPAGTWCPPSELTGESPRCVAEGTVAARQPCSGVLDCAALSTCIDAGNGPLCTALCLPSEAGLPCAGGGTCQAVGSGYGLCLD